MLLLLRQILAFPQILLCILLQQSRLPYPTNKQFYLLDFLERHHLQFGALDLLRLQFYQHQVRPQASDYFLFFSLISAKHGGFLRLFQLRDRVFRY
ncbi:hypothetical protein D9M72_369400 [compost metagenome]